MPQVARAVDGAAALVEAWLAEPALEAHAQHLANLAAKDEDAADEVVMGLTLLAAGLTFSLSQYLKMPSIKVLGMMTRAVKESGLPSAGNG